MDVFAGSEPREFISFRLGKEANGQPKLVLPRTSNTEEMSTNNNSSVAEKTHVPNESQAVPHTAIPTQEVGLNRLPSAIEIIEGTPSQSSSETNPSGRTSSSSMAKQVTAIPRSQSPDYSPSLINLLASDNSSSEESVQAYFARRVSSMEAGTSKLPSTEDQGAFGKESESEAVAVTPAANSSSSEETMTPDPSKEIHLGSQTRTENDSETELEHQANKRPRIGSVVTTAAPPRPESTPKTASSSTLVPPVHSSDEMEQEMPSVHKALSSSEFGLTLTESPLPTPLGLQLHKL